MASGKLNLYSNSGKILTISTPDDLTNDKTIIPLGKSELLDEVKAIDGTGSGIDEDLLRGLPADFTVSKATNGYQKLPNGLIIQWGVGTSTAPSGTQTFPIAFPNSVLIAFGSSNYDLKNDDMGRCVMIYNLSNTGFTCAIRETNDNESQTPFSWIAIGY